MELAVNLPQAVPGDVRVNLRGADARVAEQFLDHAQVRAVLQEVSGETVPQHVRGDVAGDARPMHPVLDVLPQRPARKPRAALRDEDTGRSPARDQSGPSGLQIPYGAVLYDPDGKTWAFVNVKGLSFERKSITVANIVGEVASLTQGPAVGAKVVTLGAAQLYGAEIGVGDE